MNITIISGSPRIGSLTHRVALNLQNEFAEKTGHTIHLISLQDHSLPAMQQVWSSFDNTPESFKGLSEIIFKTDAFILVSPEYNGSYAPAMKNLLDHFPKQHHKPFGIVTASPGAFGGLRAAIQMQQLVTALFGTVSPYMLIAPGVEKKFDENGQLHDPAFQGSIDQFVYEFLWLSEKLVKATELVLA